MPNRAERRRYKHLQLTPGFTPVYSKVMADVYAIPQVADKRKVPLSQTISRKEANRKKRPEPIALEPSIEQA